MPKIVILIDYPSKTDLVTRGLLTGSSGRVFWESWNNTPLKFEYDKEVWSVLPTRPGDGKLESFCVSKKDAEEIVGKGKYPYAFIKSGKWLHPKWFPELDKLKAKLESSKPNLVLALGPLACWAMLGDARLTIHRGTCALGLAGVKTLPSYSPLTLMRDYSSIAILDADLLKASRECQSPILYRPKRKVRVPETVEDLKVIRAVLENQKKISLDIETIPAWGQITCVGFGVGNSLAYVIPFTDTRKPDGNYWDFAGEIAAWTLVKDICQNWKIEKVLQNGVYDIQWLWRYCNIKTLGFRNDTMILHHCLYPELQKSLGFMGSLYTNEGSWKLMRRFSEKEEK